MTKEQFKDELKVGSLIYNNDKEQIFEICSSWVRGCRAGSGFPNGGHYNIKEDHIHMWHIDDQNSPLFVRFEILKKEFNELKRFVNDRLK